MADAAAPLPRYEPSGRTGAALTLAAPLAIGSAAALGIGYQWLLAHNPLIALDILLPAAFGLGLGATTIAALVLGKVRNATVTHGLAAAVAATGLGTAWVASRELSGPPGDRFPAPPSLLFFCAIFEAVATLAVAMLLPLGWWKRAVFSEQQGCFVRGRRVAVGYGPSPVGLREAEQHRGLAGLLDSGLRSYPASEHEGEHRFLVYRAAESAWLTIVWRGSLEGLRGRRVTRDVIVLRRARLTPDELERLLSRLTT